MFASLTSCLAIVGLIVSPLGAFEQPFGTKRMERTLDLDYRHDDVLHAASSWVSSWLRQ